MTHSGSSVPSSGLVLDHCTPDQAQALYHEWSLTEGWNPGTKGLEVKDVYLKADSKAFFFGKVDDEVVSIISCVRFGQEQAWLGYYIVSPKHRGKGYGVVGFKRALDFANADTRNVGLDAVLAQVKNYQKSGFTQTQWQNQRRHGSLKDLVENLEKDIANDILQGHVEGFEDKLLHGQNGRVVNLADPAVDRTQLPQIEERYAGLKRPEFLQVWVDFHANHPEDHRFGAAVLSTKEEQNGKPVVLGYGCIRPAETSYRMGPLYASSPEVARLLLVKLAVDVVQAEKQSPRGTPLDIDIDVPDKNEESLRLFDSLGWKNMFDSLRMWRGKAPESDVSGVFGVASLEVG
ncbi:hypothetical protein BGX28_004131 [Mortierella sp. GBA30]|nr:hypothetical protein BGX28_004131 [Mortierella sp. GBA30]